ncbi:MAG: hypothetical protein CEN89_463 [Candidatus Berkelbacteria bacterium Licking1014_7]|uniref:Uncharacterized protein n=1 Tax=Candidatus Berkelbacteria bacterium Licking1014_7 TaxID=2017147 RepID=A0A554LIR9_9BACT|nr:MAG: hypothetical protein CEN89_463 [Candidatus Berkelbacteria bacterium Licking1014_7]
MFVYRIESENRRILYLNPNLRPNLRGGKEMPDSERLCWQDENVPVSLIIRCTGCDAWLRYALRPPLNNMLDAVEQLKELQEYVQESETKAEEMFSAWHSSSQPSSQPSFQPDSQPDCQSGFTVLLDQKPIRQIAD